MGIVSLPQRRELGPNELKAPLMRIDDGADSFAVASAEEQQSPS